MIGLTERVVRRLRMLRAFLRPLRMPGDNGRPLNSGEGLALITLRRAWDDRAGTRSVAARERHAELLARRAARRS